jgi:hypothetical protein
VAQGRIWCSTNGRHATQQQPPAASRAQACCRGDAFACVSRAARAPPTPPPLLPLSPRGRFIKVLIVGDSGLGKTTLVKTLLSTPGERLQVRGREAGGQAGGRVPHLGGA